MLFKTFFLSLRYCSLSYIKGGDCKIKSVNNVRFSIAIGAWFEHSYGLKLKNIGILTKNLTRIEIVLHEQQEKIQSALLNGGQRG